MSRFRRSSITLFPGSWAELHRPTGLEVCDDDRQIARQIADAMGHKKTSTTEIYISRFNGEAADERIREAMSG